MRPKAMFVRMLVGLALLASTGCAHRKITGRKTWSSMDAEERQKALVRAPFCDARVIRYAKGQLEFLERTPRPDSGAASVPDVYVHGLGGNMGDFAPQILATKPGSTAIALNLPGTGRSTNGEGGYTIKDHAEAIHEFLVYRLGFKQVNLVCHSLGGQVCIAFALEYPARVKSLTLIDAAGSYDQGEFARRMATNFGRINLGTISVYNHPAITVFTGGNQSIINRLVGGDPMVLSALDSFNENYRDRIRNLSVPVFLIWGEKDPVFPVQYGFFLLGNIADARMRVIPTAGHAPQLSHPQLVGGWIDEFHRSLAQARQ